LYQNVVGSLPTASVQQEFVGLIESGQHTPVSLAMLASQTSLNLTLVGLMGALAVPLEYLPSAA
jgi:hypothetical protein